MEYMGGSFGCLFGLHSGHVCIKEMVPYLDYSFFYIKYLIYLFGKHEWGMDR